MNNSNIDHFFLNFVSKIEHSFDQKLRIRDIKIGFSKFLRNLQPPFFTHHYVDRGSNECGSSCALFAQISTEQVNTVYEQLTIL